MFAYVDPNLNRIIPRSAHTFDDNCELTLENVLSNFDHYYISHLFGWFVLTFMLRNRFLVHSWAMLDEIIELSWQHILPHLRECWWDHIFIDILFSNTVGIELALFIIRRTGMKTYDWFGTTGAKSWRDWKVFKCHRTFGFIITFYALVIGRFLGMFFFMNSLLLPPYHTICVLRVIAWAFFSYLPIREIYEDIRTWSTPERKSNRVDGSYRWLGLSIVVMECVTSYKFRKGTQNMNEDAETPLYIIIPWAVAIIAAGSFYLYLRFKKDRTTKFVDTSSESGPPKKKGKQKSQ